MKVVALAVLSCMMTCILFFSGKNKTPQIGSSEYISPFSYSLQDTLPFCGTDAVLTTEEQRYPEIAALKEAMEEKAYQFLSDPKRISFDQEKTQFTIPVVVHIIHDGGEENLSDIRIINAIEFLNQAFANTSYYDQEEGVNVDIQFCLAKRDPAGNATSGINRIQSSLTDVDNNDDELKDLIRWDPTCYVNIWVVREIAGGAAGYAYLPSAHGADYDGIVCKAKWMGRTPVGTAVLIHEMGHYLGLYHTFEGGCGNNDCLRDGDRVCDTPPDQSTAAVPCELGANTCQTDTDSGFSEDQQDMVNNYMDYGDWNCYNAFTLGQKERMHYFLTNVRQSLLDCPSCLDPCLSPVSVGIQFDKDSLEVNEIVVMQSEVNNADELDWKINGVGVGRGAELTHQFEEPGRHQIILEGKSNDPNCAPNSDTLFLDIFCPIKGKISVDRTSALVGESITLEADFDNASQIRWIVNGNFIGEDSQLITSFDTPGNYEVYAEVSNEDCGIVSETLFLYVNRPCDYEGEAFQVELKEMGMGRWIERTPDGGYLTLNSKGIVKLDFEKRVEWSQEGDFIPKDGVVNSADGSFFIVGDYSEGQVGSFLMKMSATGDIAWTKRIVDGANPEFTRVYKIEENQDGDFIIIGAVVLAGESTIEDGVAFVLKVNKQGDLLFQKIFELIAFTNVSITSDNGCLLIGEYGDPDFAAFNLLKLDSEGNVDWSRMYLPGSIPFLTVTGFNFEIQRVEEMNHILSFHSGYGEGDFYDFVPRPFLMKINEEGDIIWNKRYTHTDSVLFQQIEGLSQLENGDLIFSLGTGGSSNDGYNFSNYARVDLNGDLKWIRKKPVVFPFTSYISSLRSGEIALTGLSDNRNYTLFIDEQGFSGDCDLQNGEITVKSLEFVPFSVNLDQPDQYDLQYSDSQINSTSIFVEREVMCSSGGLAAFDASITIDSLDDCSDSLAIYLTVCNLGNISIYKEVPLAFYDNNPVLSSANILDDVQWIGQEILPDSCGKVVVNISHPTEIPSHIFAVLNDNGSVSTPYSFADDFPVTPDYECDFLNNLDSIALSVANPIPDILNLGPDTMICPGGFLTVLVPSSFYSLEWEDGTSLPDRKLGAPGTYWLSATNVCGKTSIDSIEIMVTPELILDLGPDKEVCTNQTFTFKANDGFESYQWQDGWPQPTYTAWLPGIYWVDATDECGRVHSDTINIILNETTTFDLGKDTLICAGQSVTLTGGTGFATYQWYPEKNLSCQGCKNVTVQPDTTTTYTLIAELEQGCISTDTIRIRVDYPFLKRDTINICQGETLSVFGEEQTTAGLYSKTYQSLAGCDSTHQILLSVTPTLQTEETIRICQGETANIFGIERSETGAYTNSFTSLITACDSVHTIHLEVLDTALVEEQKSICQGQTILLFGEEVSQPGTYRATFPAVNGCDSTHIVTLSVVDTVKTFQTIPLCQGESIQVFGMPVTSSGIFTNTSLTISGCDSIHQIEVILQDTLATYDTQTICKGETIELFGQNQSTPGVYAATFSSINTCDSTHYITLEVLDTVATFEEISICEGDSALIFDEYQSQEGMYSSNFSGQNNCDSTHYIQLSLKTNAYEKEVVSLCPGDSVFVFGEYIHDEGIYQQFFPSENGCDSLHEIEVRLLEGLDVEATSEASCFGQQNGVVTLSVAGGLPPYDINWQNGQVGNSLHDLAPGLYQYTVEDQMGCLISSQVEVFEGNPLLYDLNWAEESCPGEGDGQILIEPLQEGLLFSLNAGSFLQGGKFTDLPSGDYRISVQDIEGCIQEETVSIMTSPITFLKTPALIELVRGDSILILVEGDLDKIVEVNWSPSIGLNCTDCLMPITFTQENIAYQLKATDINGCEILASVSVKVKAAPDIDPPNAFSPNGDGKNEVFIIPGLEKFEKPELIVMNRWGGVVYRAKPYQNNWRGDHNGTPLPEGTYYYLLYLDVSAGNVLSGNITLIR